MKISQLASKPQLVKITLDSPEIVKDFGEAVEIWTWDRQPLDIFMKLATANASNYGDMVDVLRTLILDEDGKQVIVGEVMIPTKVLVAAMTAITELLGK
jgi:hypothetical protein